MKKDGLRAKIIRKFKATTNSKHDLPVAPNLLNREFTQAQPNRAWAADITYIWTNEGWLYLAVVMDLCSRTIVGWSMSERMTRTLVINAFTMAVKRRNPRRGLLHHSDRGSQYASADFQRLLAKHGAICSMSRKGNCWDNSPTERFFRSLKHEQLNYEKFKTQAAAKWSVIDYLAFYNGRRSHSTLGYLSPL